MPKCKGKHLTWNDRLTIEKMLGGGYSRPQIVRYLDVHHSTIYDECRGGETELPDSDLTTRKMYSPEVAVVYHERRVKNMEKPLKIGKDHKPAKWLVDTIFAGYSPVATYAPFGRTQETTLSCTLCYQTVYKYAENGDPRPLTNEELHCKGEQKRKYRKIRTAKAPHGDNTECRPEHISTRQEPGHGGIDSVLSDRGARVALLVLTEWVMYYEVAMRAPGHTAASIVSTLSRLERRIGTCKLRSVFGSIVVNNGMRFSDCWGIEHSWQCR